MSFSSDVKNEMMKHVSQTRHCQIAELTGYIINLGRFENNCIVIESDRNELIIRVQQLLEKLYDFIVASEIITTEKSIIYRISVEGDFLATMVEYCKLRLYVESDEGIESVGYPFEDHDGKIRVHREISHMLIKSECCQKTYLQTAFICCGSITDPDKGYHFEFSSSHLEKLLQIQELFDRYGINAKITARKNTNVLYVKEGQQIVDCLNVMGAHTALLNMENSIVMKEFRNNLNRQVNCEAANLIKSANAGSRQRADILLLKEKGKLDSLPDSLREIAYMRLEYPDISLAELGNMLEPPVGKSCVNHRLRKIAEIAEKNKN